MCCPPAGTLPSSWASLTALSSLELYVNSLTGLSSRQTGANIVQAVDHLMWHIVSSIGSPIIVRLHAPGGQRLCCSTGQLCMQGTYLPAGST